MGVFESHYYAFNAGLSLGISIMAYSQRKFKYSKILLLLSLILICLLFVDLKFGLINDY